jgi:hypothetical protein
MWLLALLSCKRDATIQVTMQDTLQTEIRVKSAESNQKKEALRQRKKQAMERKNKHAKAIKSKQEQIAEAEHEREENDKLADAVRARGDDQDSIDAKLKEWHEKQQAAKEAVTQSQKSVIEARENFSALQAGATEPLSFMLPHVT